MNVMHTLIFALFSRMAALTRQTGALAGERTLITNVNSCTRRSPFFASFLKVLVEVEREHHAAKCCFLMFRYESSGVESGKRRDGYFKGHRSTASAIRLPFSTWRNPPTKRLAGLNRCAQVPLGAPQPTEQHGLTCLPTVILKKLPGLRRTSMTDASHPSEVKWKLFFGQELSRNESQRIATHLESCRACQRVTLRLPVPVYRCLGRPVSPFLAWTPTEVEAQITALAARCFEIAATGRPMVVAATDAYEGLLLHVLSLSMSRLARAGSTTAVSGFVYATADPPKRPERDVVLLLGASNYSFLAEWEEARPGAATVLAGLAEDFEKQGRHADVVLPSIRREQTGKRLVKHDRAISAILDSGEPLARQAVLCTALGCDLPCGFMPITEFSAPFAEVEDPANDVRLPWYTVDGGQWISRRAISEFYRRSTSNWERDAAAAASRLQTLGKPGEAAAKRLLGRLSESARVGSFPT